MSYLAGQSCPRVKRKDPPKVVVGRCFTRLSMTPGVGMCPEGGEG